MKKIISLILCSVLVMSLFTLSVLGATIEYKGKDGAIVKITDFRDTSGHWAHDQILKWADYAVVGGNNGNFMPNNKIIRGDLAIIVDRMLGLKNTTYNYFMDLSSTEYYRESILKCVAEGYMNGVGSNKVNPRGFATREEVAVILCRIFSIDTSYTGPTTFSDDYNIGAWARPSIYALSKLGYMNGTGNNMVNPKSNITRAEIITILNNIANTYIPQKDIDSSGTTYIGNYAKNVVTSRNIELKNTTIGRNLYLTQSANTLTLTNTTIRGSLLAMSRSNISLSNAKIEQIILKDGKSTVSGVTNDIQEVYVCEYASESSLDAIPNKLVLESGVRVKIDNVMYENKTTSLKTYLGSDLKASIADEQGYVIGGPRVSGVTYSLDFSNILTLSNIKIIAGLNNIREIGVVWINNEEGIDPVNPTYKNNDGKERYDGAYNGPFSFKVGNVKGYRTYRVYVKDSEGLYAYSTPYVTKGYTFSTDMKVTDVNYPEKIQVEVEFKGSNVPNLKSVQVIYDVDELYSEKHNTISLRKYTEDFAENPIDETKYKRYIATITVPSHYTNGQTVYDIPTAFGYILEFEDGSVINRFPILTNVIPAGIKPVTSLNLGDVSFSGTDKIVLSNNKVVTNHVALQEVGIVYRETNSETISNPSDNASGWVKVIGGSNIGVKDTYTFNSSIITSDINMNTFFAPYVKTSNGYYYGSVNKVKNNWQGDVGGPSITGNPYAIVLNPSKAVITCPIVYSNTLDYQSLGSILSVKKNGIEVSNFTNASLNGLNPYLDTVSRNLFFILDGLEANSQYTVVYRVKDTGGLNSNTVSVTFNTSNNVSIGLVDKQINTDGSVFYSIGFPDANYTLESTGHYFVDSSKSTNLDISGGRLWLNNNNSVGKEVVLSFHFATSTNSIANIYKFTRTLKLY